MIRRPRLHLPGGTYYIVQLGTAQQPLIEHPEHVEVLERLLAAALERTDSVALGYCWLPHALHFCLRVNTSPPGRIMQGFASSYARAIHTRTHAAGHLFAQRHRALLIEPTQWLLPLIRYMHWLPVFNALARTPDDYAYSSHRAYTGGIVPAWLNIELALASSQLSACDNPRLTMIEYLSHAPSDQERRSLTAGSEQDPRLLGDQTFIDSLPRPVRPVRSKLSLTQLIELVSRALGVERDQVLSKSRERELALARAVIAWHASERGIATLSEVARRFNRDPSTLSIAIGRYRIKRPELFRLNALHYVVPLG